MSADEIRRLAVDFSPKKGVYCEDLKLNELVYSTLLDYAAMVERCEKARQKLIAMTDKNSPSWSLDSHAAALDDIDKIDYILHGSAVKKEGVGDGKREREDHRYCS